MYNKIIDKIVWFIPIRTLRDKTRSYLIDKYIKQKINNRLKIYSELNILTENILNHFNYSQSEDIINEHIDNLIFNLKKLRFSIPIRSSEDDVDRAFMDYYVEKNKEYIEQGDILEFFGNKYYAEKYATSKTNIKIASGLFHKGLYDNEVDYYFDFNYENTLPKDKFDCILLTGVIYYTTDITTVIKNFKSMLKPNGRLLVISTFMFNRGYNLNTTVNIRSFLSPGALIKIAEEIFGKDNIHNFEYYGDFEHIIRLAMNIRKKYNENIENCKCDKNDPNSYPIIIGMILQNKD